MQIEDIELAVLPDNFNDLLKTSMTVQEYEDLRHYGGFTPHRLTKLIANPKCAFVQEMLFFEAMTSTRAHILHLKYGMGLEATTPNQQAWLLLRYNKAQVL